MMKFSFLGGEAMLPCENPVEWLMIDLDSPGLKK